MRQPTRSLPHVILPRRSSAQVIKRRRPWPLSNKRREQPHCGARLAREMVGVAFMPIGNAARADRYGGGNTAEPWKAHRIAPLRRCGASWEASGKLFSLVKPLESGLGCAFQGALA